MQHSSWGWRRHLQLAGFWQWNICPSLIQSYPVYGIDCCRDTCAAIRGVFSQKALISCRASDLSFTPKLRHHSHHQHHTPVPGDYQIRLCSSGAVTSYFRIKGAWAAASLEQVAILPRDLRNSACTRNSLRHGKAISPANRQRHGHLLHWKRHPFLTWVLAARVSLEVEDICPSSIQFLVLAYSLRSTLAGLSMVSVHSISQTLTLIFAIK